MRRLQLFVTAAFAAAACTAGQLGEQQTAPTGSPGAVTLRLLLPSTQSFCDVIDACSAQPGHVVIGRDPGNWLTSNSVGPSCATECSNTCAPIACPLIAPCRPGAAVGVAVTNVEATWDGSYVEWSTCGGGIACYTPRYVSPGRYVARLCATPGTLTDATCTATGAEECVDVAFDLPGPSPVVVPLPSTIQGG